jgi:hypothetical protein
MGRPLPLAGHADRHVDGGGVAEVEGGQAERVGQPFHAVDVALGEVQALSVGDGCPGHASISAANPLAWQGVVSSLRRDIRQDENMMWRHCRLPEAGGILRNGLCCSTAEHSCSVTWTNLMSLTRL